MASGVPLPRAPLEGGSARWYENVLGWATADGRPVQLLTGLRFDVLEFPADAGAAALRKVGPTGPVAVGGDRMRLLIAAGGADELPGLLDWLEWRGVGLGLTAVGAGGRMPAPAPPGWPSDAARGAAVWLRPPVPGHEVEPTLPAMEPFGRRAGHGGGGTGAPDLVRLVDTVATECHRARLLRGKRPGKNAQPLAFS